MRTVWLLLVNLYFSDHLGCYLLLLLGLELEELHLVLLMEEVIRKHLAIRFEVFVELALHLIMPLDHFHSIGLELL